MAIELSASLSRTRSQASDGRIGREKNAPVGNGQDITANKNNKEGQEILMNGQGLPSVDNAEDSNISQAVSQIEDYVQNVQRDLQFSIDEETGDTVIRVFDAETKELIRQIPADELRRIAAEIATHNGVLIEANA